MVRAGVKNTSSTVGGSVAENLGVWKGWKGEKEYEWKSRDRMETREEGWNLEGADFLRGLLILFF